MAKPRHRKQQSSAIRVCRSLQPGSRGTTEERDVYIRARHLPRLIAVWPEDIVDESPAGSERILERLRQALRAERRRGRSGHWSYDLNRHLGLIHAYKAELRRLQSLIKPAGGPISSGTGAAADRPIRRSRVAKPNSGPSVADWPAP